MEKKYTRKSKKKRVHGDLAHSLAEIAVEHIANTKSTEFALREIASRLGVSHAAAYRHFKNKQALLEAIAIRGFEMLNREFANAVIGKEVSTEKLGQFYIQFGLKNPGYYRVMFGVNFAENMNADLKKVCFDSFDSLLNSIGKDTATNVKKAFFAWSLVHGFVLLLLDGQLTALAQEYSVDLATIEPVFMKMTSAALNG